jgi:hypothetical protein
VSQVDHTAAERRAQELRKTHPDRLTHTWMARGSSDGEWEVVKVRLPGVGPRGDTARATVEAVPEPPLPDDPRPPGFRDVPPFGAA